MKLESIKEIQISRQMTIYGQSLGVFQREYNEIIKNETTKLLHKIKFVVFLIRDVGSNMHISSHIRHYDVTMT